MSSRREGSGEQESAITSTNFDIDLELIAIANKKIIIYFLPFFI